MREMKDSGIEWIGMIPSSWKLERLKWCMDEINERNDPIKTKQVLSLTNKLGVVPYEEKGNQGNKAKEDYSEYKLAYENTLIVNSMNVIIGSVGISKYFGCVSPVYYVFKQNEVADLRYINYIFNVSGFQKELRKFAKGILEIRLRISSGDLFQRPIPLPTYNEQERIVDFLDGRCTEIDSVLIRTRASIEEYKQLKQAAIYHAVTSGIKKEVEMKDSGIYWIGQIPKHWKIEKLRKYTSMVTPMRDKPENLDGEIPWVRIEDYDGKYIESSKAGLGVSEETVQAMNLKVYPIGTILCTSSCALGKCAIVRRPIVSNQRFIGIIPHESICEDYLYYVMTANSERLNFLATGSIQLNLSRQSFEQLQIQIPPLKEQKEIAEYLDRTCSEIDALIAKKEQYLVELENYKKSLIYEYVTGKKEVPKHV